MNPTDPYRSTSECRINRESAELIREQAREVERAAHRVSLNAYSPDVKALVSTELELGSAVADLADSHRRYFPEGYPETEV